MWNWNASRSALFNDVQNDDIEQLEWMVVDPLHDQLGETAERTRPLIRPTLGPLNESGGVPRDSLEACHQTKGSGLGRRTATACGPNDVSRETQTGQWQQRLGQVPRFVFATLALVSFTPFFVVWSVVFEAWQEE